MFDAKIDRLHAMNLHKLNPMPSYKPSNLIRIIAINLF